MIRRRLTHIALSFAVFSALPTAAVASAGLAYMTGSLTRGPTSVWVASPNGANRHRLGGGFSSALSAGISSPRRRYPA